jgi:protein gp37
MGCDGCELWNESTGVKTCYAGVLHERYGGTNKGFSPRFNILTEHPGRTHKAAKWSDLTGKDRPDKPWLNGLPRTIFVSDMSDALSQAVSFRYLYEEIILPAKSDAGKRHRWLWLTKQASRMLAFDQWLIAEGVDWPENLWAGTSVTQQSTTVRLRYLRCVRARVRFVSAEPLLSAVDLSGRLGGIHWVITGGTSGAGAAPTHIEWIRNIVAQCKAANVAVFVKQLGAAPVFFDDGDGAGGPIYERRVGPPDFLKIKDPKGGDMSEWPEDLRVRQFPSSSPSPV